MNTEHRVATEFVNLIYYLGPSLIGIIIQLYEIHKIVVYTDTRNFWVPTRTDTVSLFYECF